jgi:hypothetical protein
MRRYLNMIAENAKTASATNIIDRSAPGNIPPNFMIRLTINDTSSMTEYVLKNHASQLIPPLSPIAFIVFKQILNLRNSPKTGLRWFDLPLQCIFPVL